VTNLSITIPGDLADWLRAEKQRRMSELGRHVDPGEIVTEALRGLRATLAARSPLRPGMTDPGCPGDVWDAFMAGQVDTAEAMRRMRDLGCTQGAAEIHLGHMIMDRGDAQRRKTGEAEHGGYLGGGQSL
jgi:hypothetical protein